MVAVPAIMSITGRAPVLVAHPANHGASAKPATLDDPSSTSTVSAVPSIAVGGDMLALSWADIAGKSKRLAQLLHLEALDHVATV